MPPDRRDPEEPPRSGVLKMVLEELPRKERRIRLCFCMLWGGKSTGRQHRVMGIQLATVLSKVCMTLKS